MYKGERAEQCHISPGTSKSLQFYFFILVSIISHLQYVHKSFSRCLTGDSASKLPLHFSHMTLMPILTNLQYRGAAHAATTTCPTLIRSYATDGINTVVLNRGIAA